MLLLFLAATAAGVPQVMPPGELDQIRAILPHIRDQELDDALRDPDTFWYDESSLPPAYQDAVPPITGLRDPNSSLPPADVISGGRWTYPWTTTGGMHRCENVRTVRFLTLPKNEGVARPIVWWREGLQYKWNFPRGTLVGEALIMTNTPDGRPVVFEIRTRRRELDRWEPDILRPFVKSADLAEVLDDAIKTILDPPENLAALREALQRPDSVVSSTIGDSHGVINAESGVDELPSMDRALAVRLLRNTPFRSAIGESWKSSGGVECFAPTSREDSIVPANYDGWMLSAESCVKCHKTAGRDIGTFAGLGEHVLYGNLPGSDEVLSWHPFDSGRAASDVDFGGPEVDLRSDFISSGFIEPYDASRHPRDIYAAIANDE